MRATVDLKGLLQSWCYIVEGKGVFSGAHFFTLVKYTIPTAPSQNSGYICTVCAPVCTHAVM